VVILGKNIEKENIYDFYNLFIIVVIVMVRRRKGVHRVVEMMTMVDIHLQIAIAIQGMDGY